jgi:hypothetical protein
MSERLDTTSTELVEALLAIENTPRTVENIRSMSVAMRRLPLLFSKEKDEMLITYCFGLLTVNFAPLWNDACTVLKAVAERSGAKVWTAAFLRLVAPEASGIIKDELETEVQPTPPAGQESAIGKVWSDCQLDASRRLQSLYENVFLGIGPADFA